MIHNGALLSDRIRRSGFVIKQLNFPAFGLNYGHTVRFLPASELKGLTHAAHLAYLLGSYAGVNQFAGNPQGAMA